MTIRPVALLVVASLACVAPVAHADPVAELRAWCAKPQAARGDLSAAPFASAPLTKAQAAEARKLLWDDQVSRVRAERKQEWDAKSITLGGKTLKWEHKHFGTKPPGGWNLYISMHGGGGAPARVNDQQWKNQVKLYQPKDSLYVAPRAPTDNWNLWHEPHIDVLFTRLVEDAIVLGEVDPNRVYVMGYSAGGDGVYQLAPRMADRWAAAAMMAGHPNDASPLGLRNIGFTIHMGANDAAYKRNAVAAEWKLKLADLRAADPGGYVHEVQIHEKRGHWMNLEDKVALEWMAKFTRDPLPRKVVWHQSSVTHDRFYWLGMPAGGAKARQHAVATREGQQITIEKADGIEKLTILLNDAMVDLDKPVTVVMSGKTLFAGVAPRTIASLHSTLAARGDPHGVFDAAVTVTPGGE